MMKLFEEEKKLTWNAVQTEKNGAANCNEV